MRNVEAANLLSVAGSSLCRSPGTAGELCTSGTQSGPFAFLGRKCLGTSHVAKGPGGHIPACGISAWVRSGHRHMEFHLSTCAFILKVRGIVQTETTL